MRLPELIRTDRAVLRPWRATDAAALAPLLEANYAYLAPWIPSRIASPAPPRELEARLSRFAADFRGDREWRFAMFTADAGGERGTHAALMLLGEISVFPRSASARVPYPESDRVEIGYWLRQDMMGRGFASEAVRAVIELIRKDSRFTCIEIRCDERNAPSGAIPERLGFALRETIADGDSRLQVWATPLEQLS